MPLENSCSKTFCLVHGLIVVKNTKLHLLSDKNSELRHWSSKGKSLVHFHYTEPDFMGKIVEDHSHTFFLPCSENRISVLINAAILWDEWYHKIKKLDVTSFLGSKDVTDFARVIYHPLVNVRENLLSDYVKYDKSIVPFREISGDVHTFMLLIRRFKHFYDSNLVKAAPLTSNHNVCTFTNNSKYMIQLKRYLYGAIQITGDMEFQRQANLFSLCDILVTPDVIDIAFAFLLKPKVKVVLLNADEKLVDEVKSFWNIKVFTEQINFTSNNSLVSLSNFVNILKKSESNRYLMYMPWEQLNNQLIGFKAACAMANVLDRILVLPYLGYRKDHPESNQWDFTFNHKDYSWSPMDNYFDFVDLPCRIVSLSNFKNLYGKQIGPIHFNPVAKATSHLQLSDYYRDILGLHFTYIINHDKMSQLGDETVLQLFENDVSKVLNFGSLFWAYGFNKTQEYPLKQYVSYMDNDLYRRITIGIRIKKRIAAFSSKSIKSRIGARILLSVHIRRGDYWNKCRAISDSDLQSRCYPSIENIKQKIYFALQSVNPATPDDSQNEIYGIDRDRDSHYVYISTNLDGDRSELNELMKEFNTLFFEDIHDMMEVKNLQFDPIDMALLDRELGINSDVFIGNFYSSFSRTIFEGRELLNRDFKTF